MPRILLAEDNALNSDMLSRRLTRHGYEVIVAEDGARCVELAHSEVPDLILMDMSLPEIDGWEATRRLKQDPSMAMIPVIALTAHAMSGGRLKAIEAGCDEYETKPVEFYRLVTKIEAQLFLCRQRSRQAEKCPDPAR